MKQIFMLMGMLLAYSMAFPQKPALDTAAFKKWNSVGSSSISDDGKHCSYIIENLPKGSQMVVVQSLDGSYKTQYSGAESGAFAFDGRYVCQKSDTLLIIDLVAKRTRKIPKVENYLLGGPGETNSWLVYKNSGASNQLNLLNLKNGKTTTYSDVFSYTFSKDGGNLLVGSDKPIGKSLVNLDLLKGKTDRIWTADKAKKEELVSTYFSENGKCAALLVQNHIDGKSIKIFREGVSKTYDFQLPKSFQNDGYYISLNDMRFNAANDRIFFSLAKDPHPVSFNKNLPAVDVWSYRDSVFYPAQSIPQTKYFTAVLDLLNAKFQILQKETDNSIEFPFTYDQPIKGGYVLATKFVWFNDLDGTLQLQLINTRDGKRIIIPTEPGAAIRRPHISPCEKYVMWYDKRGKCFSFDVGTGKIVEISRGINYPLYDSEKSSDVKNGPFGIGGWLKDDKGILIYDRYDLWLLDPTGKKLPLDVTNGYGRKNGMVLGMLESDIHNYELGEEMILAGFNRDTKVNSFLKIVLGKQQAPVLCSKHSYSIHIPRTVPYLRGSGTPAGDDISPRPPIKARKSGTFLVYRMSAKESPNLFVTNDFKSFRPVSSNFPERNYNWISSELVKFKMLDGKQAKGVLYKPENFDRNKKYPVIMQYYEEKSDQLHMYMKPNFSIAVIDIPYFVSNGYLVFIPDIYFEKGHTGKGTMNSILPARDYLASLSYVDSTKIGLNGQSFGGYETYFIITHSDRFAAAVGGSGSSNLISSYGQLSHPYDHPNPKAIEKGIGNIRAHGYEYGQTHIGSTPWDRPDLYIENSPLFSVRNITAPLLIWHSKADGGVPFEQAVELFWAMKHSGKKVWMLQYDQGGHSVSGKDASDLTIRMKQFFDYYLKGAPAPLWMTKGIPFKYKQVETGLEYDITGAKP